MGTKRPSCTLFDTSNINTSDRKLQPGGKISRDPSPRPAMTAQSEREREGNREQDWRRERETEKMRDKARYNNMDPRERYPERDRAPVPRPRGERERRQEDDGSRNGRPLSNLERLAEREVERGMKKGETFPRMRKSSPGHDRRMTAAAEMDKERGERRQRDRPKRLDADDWERERERTWQRERYRERERDEIRSRAKEEGKNTGRRPVEEEKFRQRERYQEPDQDRRREAGETWDRRERGVERRDKGREREVRVPSPQRRRDREIYPDRNERERTHRREGKRDTRSEGDSDERELRRERERDREREELIYQHSRSEGEMRGQTERERRGCRDEDRQRYRDADQSRRREVERERERYRESDRREGERWREDDRHREHKQKRKEVRERDPRWDDSTGRGGRSHGKAAPRVPPRAQSSGEWSTTESDRDVEEQRAAERSQREKKRNERQERERGETRGEAPEQRRMWLEPQRGKNSKEEFADRERPTRRRDEERGMEGRRVKEEPGEGYSRGGRYGGRREYVERESEGVSVDGEEVWREVDKGGKEHLSDSDGGIEGSRRRDAESRVTDNTEDSDREEEGGSGYWVRAASEGGSETGWKQERDSVLSGEDGFVTVSSGGTEEDEREEDEEEEEEEEFEDCQEFLEVPRDGNEERQEEWTAGKEEVVDDDDDDGQGKEKQPKYVFCVIGQTLPRSKRSTSQDDRTEGVERTNPNLESRHHSSDDATLQAQDDLQRRDDECPIINNQETERNMPSEERATTGETPEEDIRIRPKKEHPYATIGPINRDSQTERLLVAWREKTKEDVERETLPSNPYADVFSQVDYEKFQPILDGLNTGAMSPEEVEAIRIRLSGAWSMSEEPKRHSQAPHLKWAKDVVREILGRSEDQTADDAEVEEEASESDEQQEAVEPGEAVVIKLMAEEERSDPELEEEEPLEEEGLRDDEDDRSKSWGEVELRNVLETIDKRRRNSRFFNAAQLYQQYSEAAQNFEILRQARSDVVSVCENNAPSPAPSPPPARRPLPPLPPVRHPHSLPHTGSITSVQSLPLPEPPKSERRPSSPRLSISLTQSSSLWRELPAVRNSAELEELTDGERRLQEVRFEVVTSEASYCRSLDIVVEHFVKSKQLGALLTTQDRNWLFSRLADVRAISHSFLSKLEERVESDIMSFTVCDIIARHCQRFKMVYVPYLTNQSYQDATYQRLMNENPGFKRIVEKLERSPVCQRLPLRSFLVLPFQRITRIKLLVQNIVKRTTPGTPEATQAIKALKLLEKLIQESNDSITQMKSIESLVSLSAKVDFECRTLPLISQSRRLVREGPVTELMDFSLKDTERNIYLHLFNDYLLLSLQKEGGRFTVIDHSPVSELRAENCRVKLHSLQKNLFRLHMLHKSLLLRTDTQSDKLRWISALSRPHPDIDFNAAQDFTQMQCIRAFIAQQPDELSLDKADIILVHQQSSDNWVEGTRLSDRHRGWVPASHLETITNSSVREHNLSDALKLTTATAAV